MKIKGNDDDNHHHSFAFSNNYMKLIYSIVIVRQGDLKKPLGLWERPPHTQHYAKKE